MTVIGNPRSFHKKFKFIVEIDDVVGGTFGQAQLLGGRAHQHHDGPGDDLDGRNIGEIADVVIDGLQSLVSGTDGVALGCIPW